MEELVECESQQDCFIWVLNKIITAVEFEILTLYATIKARVLVNTNPFTGQQIKVMKLS